MVDKQQVIDDLSHGANEIIFTKQDGTERTMVGTRDPKLIASEKAPKGSNRQTAEDQIRVYDLEVEQWRSFKMDRLISITPVPWT